LRRTPTIRVVGDLATNLRAARKERKWTQEKLGERSGIHPTEISRIEGGYRDPQVSTVIKLAEGLGMPPGQLLE
jgi:transcriptional regulator with XRE-family HTH domain